MANMEVSTKTLRGVGEQLVRDFKLKKREYPESSLDFFRRAGHAKLKEFQLAKARHNVPEKIPPASPQPSGMAGNYAAMSDRFAQPSPPPASPVHPSVDANQLLDEMAKMRAEARSPASPFRSWGEGSQESVGLTPPKDHGASLEVKKLADGAQDSTGSILDSLVNMELPESLRPQHVDNGAAPRWSPMVDGAKPVEWLENGGGVEGLGEQGSMHGPEPSILDSLVNMPVSSAGPPMDFARDPHMAGPSAKRFASLQQHIDTLTQEKFELQRGLDTQMKLTQSLSEENQNFTEHCNRQSGTVEELKKRLEMYEAEMGAQALALENVANERDACRSGMQEFQERVKALVDENLSLEERNRELRVSEIRLTKRFEDFDDVKQSLESDIQRLEKDKKSLSDAVTQFREENSTLKNQLRGISVPTPVTPKQMLAGAVESTSIAVQTDLPENERQKFPSSETPRLGASNAKLESGIAGGRHPEIVDMSNEDFQTIVSTQEERNEALSLDFLKALDTVDAGLSREESAVLDSINRLMEGLEDQRRAMVAKLHASRGEIASLRRTNQDLSHKLAMQTQRLELAGYASVSVSRPTTPPELPAHERGPSSPNSAQTGLTIESSPTPISITPISITGTERRGRAKSSRWGFW
ncbi:hypothetical protein BSKO_08723 [Bryopsis sp. KO-2023]|nr:hypothetical protein BSKO_08723 [Bryopsis sp. KO-2023]